jgi:CubicO group peptidase (beta-lactamase class C family)
MLGRRHRHSRALSSPSVVTLSTLNNNAQGALAKAIDFALLDAMGVYAFFIVAASAQLRSQSTGTLRTINSCIEARNSVNRSSTVRLASSMHGRLAMFIVCCCALLFSAIASAQDSSGLRVVMPAEAGLDSDKLASIDQLIKVGIEAKKMPGAVVCIGHEGKIGYLKAFGHRRLLPDPQSMEIDSLFDLASLTKPIATATSIMILVEQGEIRLRDLVASYLPEFAPHNKDKITVEHLLTHTSGLLPDNNLTDYQEGAGPAWKKICELELQQAPGEKFVYSDVGFIVLGELIHRLSGQDLNAFSRENLFNKLNMSDTGFLPDERLRDRAVSTQERDGHWMQGEVHDPRAYALGGVAGHAGLFSTARDLAIYAQLLLDQGHSQDRQILGSQTITLMTRSRSLPGGNLRGLGWDKQSAFSLNRSELMSDDAFGHGGFTGTAIWIDPQLDLFVIFLSNRVHPAGNGSVNDLVGRVGSVAVASIKSMPVK